MKETEADKAARKHLDPVEPDFTRQSGEVMTDAEQADWFAIVGQEFRDKGAVHVRYSAHPDIDSLRLVEAWKAFPANEGDPRWALQAG